MKAKRITYSEGPNQVIITLSQTDAHGHRRTHWLALGLVTAKEGDAHALGLTVGPLDLTATWVR